MAVRIASKSFLLQRLLSGHCAFCSRLSTTASIGPLKLNSQVICKANNKKPRVSSRNPTTQHQIHSKISDKISEYQKAKKSRYQDEKTPQKALAIAKKLFNNTPPEGKGRENFKSVIDTFQSHDVRNRGYLQFMEIALKNMERFGVEKDVEAYNRILDLVPKGPFKPTNFFQSIMTHAPEQQLMGFKVLQKMEDHTIMPNRRTREIIYDAFGAVSHPMKKYQGLMYWFPKMWHVNPFPLPEELPKEPIKLCELGLKRIAEYEAKLSMFYVSKLRKRHEWVGVDIMKGFPKMWHVNPFPLPEELPKEPIKLCELGLKRIAEYEAKLSMFYLKGSYPDSENPEFIATMQSQEQREMLEEQPLNRALYVEGAFTLWLRSVQLSYFILRGDPFTLDIEEDEEETGEKKEITDFLKDYKLSIHDYAKKKQENSTFYNNASNPIQEGPVFAICMTSTPTEGTLRQWINTLQENNPHLAKLPVVFNLFNLDTGKHHVSELIGDQKLIASS